MVRSFIQKKCELGFCVTVFVDVRGV